MREGKRKAMINYYIRYICIYREFLFNMFCHTMPNCTTAQHARSIEDCRGPLNYSAAIEVIHQLRENIGKSGSPLQPTTHTHTQNLACEKR